MIKIISESEGIDKNSKESLINKIKDYLSSHANIDRNSISVIWNNKGIHPIVVVKTDEKEFKYKCTLKPSGRTNTKRADRVSIKDKSIGEIADGLKCLYDSALGHIYLVDDFGNKIFRVTSLDIFPSNTEIPIDSVLSKESPLYNDDINNLVFNNTFGISELSKIIKKDLADYT